MLEPSQIPISPEMVSLIAEIDEFKGAWQLLGKLSPERLQLLRKVATIESIGSSTRIEGAKLSDRQVEELLSKVQADSFSSRDEEEVAGYANVCEEIFQNFPFIPFSTNVIKQLHSMLLKFSTKDAGHRGEYKKVYNNIEAFDLSGKSVGIICKTASPFETPLKMDELLAWTREKLEEKILHPLLVIGLFVVIFLAIHPFQDGNGRLSRILTSLLLLKSGYLYVPYSSLESIVEKNKESYYLALRKTQASLSTNSPDPTAWLTFFLQALARQKRHLEEKIDQEKKLQNLHPLSAQILSLLSKNQFLTILDFETITGANRNTLKKQLATLVTNHLILQIGKGRATKYTIL